MRKGKRLLSLLLSLAMVLSVLPGLAWAADPSPSEAAYAEYAAGSMARYLRISGLDDGSDFTMTQLIPVYNDDDENNRAVFCFKDGVCVAQMMVSYVNGEFASSFTQGDYSAVTEAAAEDTPVALAVSGEALMLVTETGNQVIAGRADSIPAEVVQAEADSYSMQEIICSEVSFAELEGYVQPRAASAHLVVPFVGNEDSPDKTLDSEGNLVAYAMCWAACAASVIMFEKKGTGLTARSIYDRLKAQYYTGGYDYPVGQPKWIHRAFDMYGVSYTYFELGTNFDTVKSNIESGKPIYAAIRAANKGGHAVLIIGFDSGYGYYYYELLDPNREKKDENGEGTGEAELVLVQVSSSAYSTSFTYVAPWNTYTEWDGHYRFS